MNVRCNKNILIVDDDSMARKLAEFVLTKDGYNVTSVDSGKACIECLKKDSNIDLVLLDIEMPQLNGIETLERIRSEKTIAETRVIFLTANDFSKFEEALQDAFKFVSDEQGEAPEREDSRPEDGQDADPIKLDLDF